MSLTGFISNRLSLRGDGGRKWPPAICVAVGGISVSFIVMMLSIAVVKGFKEEIKRKIMGFDAQISVMSLASYYGDGNGVVSMDDALAEAVEQALADQDGAALSKAEAALSFSQPGIIKTADDFAGVVFRGYGEGHGWEFERSVLTEGELPDGSDQRAITVSESTASRLGLKTGDKVDAYFITGGDVRPRRFEVKGLYRSNFGEYDDMIVFASAEALRKLDRLGENEGHRLEINGLEEQMIYPVAERLQSLLNRSFAQDRLSQSLAVSTVFSSGAVYFNWLELLDTNVVVILLLMGCVSAFTLISCVIILILQRVRMVGILKSLGAGNGLIRNIFIRLGLRVTVTGLLIGNAVSMAVIWCQSTFRVLPLDPEAYYLSYVPVSVTAADWILLNAGVLVVSFAVMLVPTGIVSRLSPVKPLRFE
ncbi:MAG: FtsX-like permease family protein [Muribaculaceae bacterium]|nr:FtsX-like permease family protein [Muribaculaceae bacterium]